MPAVSTPDSAPEHAAQRPADGPLVAPSAKECGAPEAVALDEPCDAGLTEPMDRLDVDRSVFPPLDDAALSSGSLATVAPTAAVTALVMPSRSAVRRLMRRVRLGGKVVPESPCSCW